MKVYPADMKYIAVAVVLAIAFVITFSFGQGITGFAVASGEGPEIEVNINTGREVLTYDVPIRPRDTVFDALKRVAVVEYDIKATGAIITGINGLKGDDEHYWLCFVNGELPEIGCDYYYPLDGDTATFRYATVGEASKYF